MKKIIMLLSLLIFAMSSGIALVINIPADQSTIQDGIDEAVDGDTVLVQPGTYIENINFNGKAITLGSLYYTTQDASYISQTIIDGNQNGSVVTFGSGEDSTSVLIGFSITNGLAVLGGGIYCESSSPSLENMTITDNSAYYGGGICCYYSSPSLDNVTITGNSGSYDGGGGIYCESSSPSLVNVTITNNSALSGGGIYCRDNSSPSLDNVTITNNSANSGGGIYCRDNSSPSLVNVTITNNLAYSGSGIYCNNSSPSLVNVTITNNSAYHGGGGIYCRSNSSPSLVNCILWNNSPQEIYFDVYYGPPNTMTIAYSDIEGGLHSIATNNNGTVNWLEGNIDADPLFLDAANGNYYLIEDSPCIDAGVAYFEYEGEVLVDLSEDEYYGIAPDMGAYECEVVGLLAEFLASETTGCVPFEVQFFDFSFGGPTGWTWDFDNDGVIDSYEQNPVWIYYEPGVYSVSLTVSDDETRETSTEIKVNYIEVLSDIFYVPEDYNTIQDAIDASSNGITIIVSEGTYFENINFNGKAITIGSLFYTTQDTSYISQTIIDGNQDGSVVIFNSGEDSTSVLTGFTITNGDAQGSWPNDCGGGICCIESSPSLTNLLIENNLAWYGGGIYCDESNPDIVNVTVMTNLASPYNGGGIYCRGSNPDMENVIIENNSAADKGGGINCERGSSPNLENVIIRNNSTTDEGGGIYCNSSSPTLSNVTIADNSANSGGGIYCYSNSSPNLENMTIENNSANFGGGICCNYYSNPSLRNVSIVNNIASDDGGGIGCWVNSSLNLENVKIANNTANTGGGICSWQSSLSLENVTISNNSANSGGGIYCVLSASLTLVNCIMWNDTPQEVCFRSYYSPNTITIAYSDIEGGLEAIVTNNNGTVNWLEGNINAEPLFVDMENGYYHLTENSPCIDVGIAYLEYGCDILVNLSLDEYLGFAPDMGRFEYEGIIELTAEFLASETTGCVPFEVQFFDRSFGNPVSWQWDFENDGEIDSYEQNPVWIYEELGVYSVSLTVSDDASRETSTETKEDYIIVNEPPDIAVYPTEYNETLASGDFLTQILTIENNGGSDLEVNFEVIFDELRILHQDELNNSRYSQSDNHRRGNRNDEKKSIQPNGNSDSYERLLKNLENRWILFTDDMENGINGWTIEVYENDDLWHQSNINYNSENTSWWCGIEGQDNYNTGNRINTAIISPIIDLSTVNDSVSLYFYENYDTEVNYDHCLVDISTDNGNNWTHLRGDLESSPSGSSGGWILSALDISEYIGNEVQIRFYFDTIDNIAQNYPGWFIDDIVISSSSIVDNWLSLELYSAVIPFGSSMYIEVGFDATDLIADNYSANLLITSNDPDEPEITIPVNLDVFELLTAEFVASDTIGNEPFEIQFTDLSSGDPASWGWDFENDGVIDSNEQNPVCVYYNQGVYSVSLTVYDDASRETSTELKEDYITVLEILTAEFTAIDSVGCMPFEVQYMDLSTGNPTSWNWDFENDGVIDSNEQNPVWVYEDCGIYSVYLEVYSDEQGYAEILKDNCITVHRYGDVDDNNSVEAFDASLVLKYNIGIDPAPEAPLPWEDWRITVADVDGNGEVEAYDSALILQHVVCLIDQFPVEIVSRRKATSVQRDSGNSQQ